MAVDVKVGDVPLRVWSGFAGAVLGVVVAVCPVMTALAQEPPQPVSAPRNAVEKGQQVKKGDVPPAKDVPAKELDAKPTAEAAPAVDPDKAQGAAEAAAGDAALSVDRGHKRGEQLKKLEGGPDVVLEKDPNNPPSVMEPLRLEEAVAFALKNNYAVLMAQSKTEASKWDKRAGYGAYLPSVTAEYRDGKEENRPASYQVNSKINGQTQAITVADDTHHAWSNSISVRQPIIDLSIIADILQRTDTLDAVEADEMSAREKTAYDTIASFLRVTKSRLTIGFAESYKQNLDKLAQRMTDRVSGGGAPGVELDRITARSVTARSAIIEAHSEYQAAIVEFRRLTGVNPIKLALPDNLMPAVPESVDVVLDRSMKNNPDFKGANKRADAAIGDMNKSFAALMPKFAVEFADTRTWNVGGVAKTDPTTCPTGYNCVFPYSHSTALMGVFTWTLNGGVDFASGMGNRARAQAASYNATDIRQKLDESVRVEYDAMNAANGRIEAVTKAVEASNKVAVAFEEQYMAGTRQLLDLLDAYERLYQSQNELTTLLVSEAQASYLLRREMGELEAAIMSPDKLN